MQCATPAAHGGLTGLVALLAAGMKTGPVRRSPEDLAREYIERLFDRRYVPASALPDYFPPMISLVREFPTATSPVMADADGNLWIHVQVQSPPVGGAIFDVVSRAGAVIDRVQIPGATSIVGFGPGVVYLAAREGVGVQIARARIH